MPVHVQPTKRLTITLWRADDIIDVRQVSTGRDAVRAALLMIVAQDELMGGDRLTVSES
jgi:hypothetical protein